MSYKLFIDDERWPVSKNDWVIARSSSQAIQAITEMGMPDEIAFDHDLGGDDTSIEFIKWLIDELVEGRLSFPTNFKYSVHSQNPIGAKNISYYMDGLIRYFGIDKE